MIKQLVLFITLFLLSLSILPSCTIFGSDESDVGAEDYYEGEEGEGAEEGVSVKVREEEEASDEVIRDAEKDVYYIDEEDEDIFEDGVMVEESASDDTGEEADDGGEGEEYADEGDIGFFPPEDSGKSKQASSVKQDLSAPKKWISYKKLKTQPYNQAGFLVNAVYIARKGDDIQSVSNKIFGVDQVDQLHAINLFLKKRGIKVGDKIYYQSPNRPQDSGQLLFYFEDKGIPPQYHQAQAGENIRQIASQLLGDSNSWKEIWATNPDLQSKGVLNQSVTFKYWPEGADSNVNNQLVPEPDPSVPPSPGENNMNAEEGELKTPLPPDPSEEEPAVLPEQPSQADTPESEKIGDKLLSEIDIILAIILALGTIFCAIIIVRKRNKRKEFDYTATNFKIDED